MVTSISAKKLAERGLGPLWASNGGTMAMMNYGTHTGPFTQKFVRRSCFVPQSCYDPYGAQYSQKMFKFEYLLEPPSQMQFEVMHKEDVPVLYVRKI